MDFTDFNNLDEFENLDRYHFDSQTFNPPCQYATQFLPQTLFPDDSIMTPPSLSSTPSDSEHASTTTTDDISTAFMELDTNIPIIADNALTIGYNKRKRANSLTALDTVSETRFTIS